MDLDALEFSYHLPEHKIAHHPPRCRDQSRLLISRPGAPVHEDQFVYLHRYLKENDLLVFNNTKVVHARLLFQKNTGAEIEVFCLESADPGGKAGEQLLRKPPVVWKCFVKNARKWKKGPLSLRWNNGILRAEKIKQDQDMWLVRFSWEPEHQSWLNVMEMAGHVPLPPYIKRNAQTEDKKRYQTLFAAHHGSVAAPTAGLHFTPKVFNSLEKKNVQKAWLTLHVGAGTFKPVVSGDVNKHQMHREQVVITRKTLEILKNTPAEKVIAVGTTAVRTLESLYWYAQMLHDDNNAPFTVPQWMPYKTERKLTRDKSIQLLINKMDKERTDILRGSTCLMIAPPYSFSMIGGMVTNFHQPGSTLLLLVAAFLGEKRWKEAYRYALDNNFRFLSYGDACLFY